MEATIEPTETKNGNTGQRVKWYRTPLTKQQLAELNAKSDLKGFAQSLGHLGLMAVTGGGALYGASHGWRWFIVLALVFAHGTIGAFMINAVHELVHKSVFKTQKFNDLFVRIFSFLGWNNFEHFYASHMRHHQYTLHQPDDLEVVLPIRVMTQHFWKYNFINPLGARWFLLGTIGIAKGKLEGGWNDTIFSGQSEKKAATIGWARTLLIGHGLILAVSIIGGIFGSRAWFLLPLLTSLIPCYGGWLFFLCNNTQHVGLQDAVPDFRLCCRTFTVNPFVQFLYWHMNFHTEHHMYAAVPCYNLPKLHRAIKHELPPCPHGLTRTWQEIAAIQRIQEKDSTYQHVAPLPEMRAPETAPLDSRAQIA